MGTRRVDTGAFDDTAGSSRVGGASLPPTTSAERHTLKVGHWTDERTANKLISRAAAAAGTMAPSDHTHTTGLDY